MRALIVIAVALCAAILIILGRTKKTMSAAFDRLSAAVDNNTAKITEVAELVTDAKALIVGLRETQAAGGTISDAQFDRLQEKLADADAVLSGAASSLTEAVDADGDGVPDPVVPVEPVEPPTEPEAPAEEPAPAETSRKSGKR